MQILKNSLLGTFFFLAGSAACAADLSPDEIANLGKYETKLFEHAYNTETTPDRLDRIERFVFGTPGKGDEESRLKSLADAMGSAESQSDHKKSDSEESNGSLGSSEEDQPTLQKEEPKPVKTASKPQRRDFYDDDPMKDNGSGTSSNSADEDAPPKANASSKPAYQDDTTPPKSASNSGASGSSDSFKKSDYPRVASLEKSLLGMTYSDQPLDERVDRLEIRAFKKPSNIDDLSERIDNLIKFAKQSEWSDQNNTTASAASNKSYYAPRYSGNDDDPTQDMGSSNMGGSPMASAGMGSGQSYSSNGYPGGGGSTYSQSFGGSGISATTIGDDDDAAAKANGGWIPAASESQAAPAVSRPSSGSSSMSPYASTGMPMAARRTMQPMRKTSLDKEADMMEKQLLGKTYKKDALLDRLSRLETTIFPNEAPPTGMSIPQRFDRLLAALGPTDGTRVARDDFGSNNMQSGFANSNNNPNKPGLLSGIGRAIGSGMASFESASTYNNMGYGGYPGMYGSPYSPYGYGGYGAVNPYYGGYGGMGGFGGLNGFGGGFGNPYGGGFNSGLNPFRFMNGGGMNRGFGF